MAKRANKTRTPKKLKSSVKSDIEITDENPVHVAYPNPPGYKYVDAIVTYEDGETQEGIYLLSTDQIARINAHK